MPPKDFPLKNGKHYYLSTDERNKKEEEGNTLKKIQMYTEQK